MPPEVTELLAAWRAGDEAALERLTPLVYAELRRIAKRFMQRERQGRTLQTTALVHEAYLRLVDTRRVQWRDRAHFFAMAARVMRRILIDAARARLADKRGGFAQRVSLDDALGEMVVERPVDFIALDDALEQLAAADPRKAKVVEMRFFAGLEVREIASVLDVSTDTITRDWNFARTWLKRALTKARAAAG